MHYQVGVGDAGVDFLDAIHPLKGKDDAPALGHAAAHVAMSGAARRHGDAVLVGEGEDARDGRRVAGQGDGSDKLVTVGVNPARRTRPRRSSSSIRRRASAPMRACPATCATERRANSKPAIVRSLIRALSNSATAINTPSWSWPTGFCFEVSMP